MSDILGCMQVADTYCGADIDVKQPTFEVMLVNCLWCSYQIF